MNKFKGFGVAARLAIGFGFLLFLMVGLTIYSTEQVTQIDRNLATINDINSVKQRYAINFRGSVHDRAIAIRDVTLVTSASERTQVIGLIEKLAASYAENEKRMADMIASPAGANDQEKMILAEISDIQAKTNPLVAEIISLQNAGNGQAAQKILLEQARPLFVAWLGAINKFIDYQEAVNKSIGGAVRETASQFRSIAFLALGIAFVLSLIAASLAARSITRPLSSLQHSLKVMAEGNSEGDPRLEMRRDEIGLLARTVGALRDAISEKARHAAAVEATRSVSERDRLETEAKERSAVADQTNFAVNQLATALQSLANGDLTCEINSPFIGSLDKLRTDFNSTIANLRQAIERVAENARTIAAGAQEIRSASDDLSKRTEQQAASVEETAAALEEITTTVADASNRAQEAGQLVRQTKDHAEHSGTVVRTAVDAMGKIESSASEIGSIIGVIDEIAFQTNLLALNAGVEAARAGDAGKGFAVVAQEVRELAQRSAKAAKEIKDLINASNGYVQNGVSLVAETGKALQLIVTQVQQVDSNVGAIVQASKEQAVGLKEINTAINTMDQGTQQNAAMVEEATAAAHGLAKEADALFQLVGQFKTGPEVALKVSSVVSGTVASRPIPSPARQMTAKIGRAFSGNTAQAAEWEEF
ncbi:HAMP domain-containing protein [Agrobacterium tumefaciens]|uniref:HAMP domain-containing methyl-accepting chemotaxis protein n=1 Tax=Agrobacterium tumefaciens TaxID=358 RepID=UPI0015730C34|nr:methyl-accepting chemotaxis protein [Agrobacterium tumefaciens]MCZ7497353.1 methyl-accepting chemotaxis protein [Rhizobium rhizogenes]NTE56567.1 HAMP domain-containing protein [Agrobacterium tumefaciens]NTE74535.1 HAMP domain-containing protein [Agrobacterium tumefaciens]